MKIILSICLLLTCSFNGWAQLPKTEIWVFDMVQDVTGYTISNPTKVKVGNGYNNQPYFTQDGQEMYFVSNGKNGGKTDIYKYQFRKKRKNIKRLTRTKHESEYSPMLTPNGERISCVRVAKDTITQNLCTYNLNGKKPQILFPEIKTFGYYCWKSQIDLLAFHVPEPFVLKRHNFPYKKHDSLHQDIGRCIVNNRGKILYVHKKDSTRWYIKRLNNKRIGNRKYDSIAADRMFTPTIKGAEDFALIRGKHIVMAKDGFIYWKKDVFTNPLALWAPLFNLHDYKLYDVYRVAVSPATNKIAVVAYLEED